MSALSWTRKCHVIKEESEEFEFYLKVDERRNGQIITSVTRNGPADRAGLKDGDRVIEINGNNVEDKDHNAIVDIIRECIATNEITFLVIDEEKDPRSKKGTESRRKSSNGVTARPRICKIKKKNNSFGFFLEAQGEANPGHFIKKVTKGGAADGTGLLDGDRVIAVGKTNVEKELHTHVVNLIKKAGNKVSLLVIEEEGYKEFKKRNIPITEKMAKGGSTSSKTSTSSNHQKPKKPTKSAGKQFEHEGKVRVVHVFKHPDGGYGFFLRSKKGSSGEFIGDIDKEGSADICGLRNDDRVMAVNGKPIIGMPHADVVALIKSKRCQVVFVVMDETALRKFKDKDDFPSKDDIVRTHPHTIRSVKLEKAGGGYGLYLKMEKGSPLHIISDVEKGGAADRAGLLDDEIVIAVEGSSVMADTHEECVQKIKDAGDAVGLLVCGRKSADFLHKLKVAIDLDLHKEWPSSDEFAVPEFERPPKTKEEPVEVVKKVAAVAKVIEKADDIEMKPRLCRIEKREGGFGFFLKDENGHYLINVEDQGPAYHAGVLEYDRIIEINGDNAEKLTHNDVVTKIRQSGDTVTFLVVNKEEDKYFQERGILISSVLLTAAINEESELSDDHKPRLCKLTRTTKGYGFHLMGESNQQGQFVKEIVSGGAADSAGLRNGDRIVEVNDVNVMTKSHDEIVKKITENSDGVTFLVIDKEGEAYYKRKGVAIVAGLVAAKAIDELVEEKQDEKADAENDSIGHGSAASSIIETEATVHQEAAKEVEDDENKVGEAIAAVVAVKAVEEVIEDIQERKEEQEESKEEKIENAVEEIAQQISEVSEEERATEEEEEIGFAAKAAVAVVAASAVEEIVDNHVEEEIREKVLEEKVEEAIESLSDTEKSSEGVAETIEDAVEEIADEIREAREEQDKVAAEKVAAGIVAAAVVQKVLEREDEESKRESDNSRSSSPRIAAAEEETLKDAVEEIVEENEALEKAIENHIEEEEQDEIKKQATIAAALVQSEMMNKINGEGSEKSDGEKSDGEGEVNLEPEFVAPAVVVAAAAVRAASPEPVQEITPREIIENHVEESKKIEAEIKIEGESKSVEAVITIEKKPQPAAVLIKEAVSEPEPAPPKSLAAAIIEQTEQPKLRPTPEPQKVPFVWGQHKLRPVNKQPAKPAAEIADVVEKQNESSDAAPKSTVAAMREAIERRNRANQRDALANEIKDELAQLSKQNGAASKRIEMFGGSARKSNSNAPPKTKKQMSWTGEGMTIKIVET